MELLLLVGGDAGGDDSCTALIGQEKSVLLIPGTLQGLAQMTGTQCRLLPEAGLAGGPLLGSSREALF